jgi:hypothetical protein
MRFSDLTPGYEFPSAVLARVPYVPSGPATAVVG